MGRSIKFEFGLAAYANGGFVDLVFNAAIDLTIFGKRLYFAASFNLNDPVGSVRAGADEATEWYKDKTNRRNPTSTAENYYDNPNPNTDFEMAGKCLCSVRLGGCCGTGLLLQWHSLKYYLK